MLLGENSLNTSLGNPSKPFTNLNIFFMGLSNRWGTEERTILKDCILAQEAGAKVYLYTYKDSVLDWRAKEQGIEPNYIKPKSLYGFSK